MELTKARPGKVAQKIEMAHVVQLINVTHSQPQCFELMLQAITVYCFLGSCWHNLAVAQPPEVLLAFLMANSNDSTVNANNMTETKELIATQIIGYNQSPSNFQISSKYISRLSLKRS